MSMFTNAQPCATSRRRRLEVPRGWFLSLSLVLIISGASAQEVSYNEAPQLAQQVEAGELPPVAERLPTNPLVVEPVERIGEYGGDWRLGLLGGGDGGSFNRTIGYDYLVRWDPEWNEVIPNVAESFEATDDATEYTFTLREGLRWSDGEPYTADDIVFWFEDVHGSEVNVTGSVNYQGAELEAVEKIDDYTVVFRFAEPNGLFLQRMATPGGDSPTRYPRHYLEQFHIRYNPDGVDALVQQEGADDWVNLFQIKGGGIPGTPYNARWMNPDLPTLEAWTITIGYGEGPRVVAERNPYYWKVDTEGNQLPYLDRVVFTQFEDVEVLTLSALGGEIDMQDRHFATIGNRAVLTDGQQQGDYRFFETVPAFMNTSIIALNLTHNDPVKREVFQNKDFRIGLSHAIDRQEIIDLVFIGQGEPFQAAPRPESEFYHEELAKQYTEYDVDLANEYLDRAGYAERDGEGYRLGPDGNRITFTTEYTSAVNTFWGDVMELVQLYWQAVGIDAQIRNIDRSLLYTRKAANEHDAVVWQGDGGLDVILEPRWYFPFSDESNFAQAWQVWRTNPEGTGAMTQPQEPPEATQRQIELYEQLEATGDVEEQAALMNEILDIAAEEFYAIGINLYPQGYGVVKNAFHNVPTSMPNAWLYPHPAPTRPEQFFISSGTTER